MKNIKSFKRYVINEAVKQFEIDEILDKINTQGIDSLDTYEREKLDNSGNKDYDTEQKLIEEIKEVVERNGSEIIMGKLGPVEPEPHFLKDGVDTTEMQQGFTVITSLRLDTVIIHSSYGSYYSEVSGPHEFKYEDVQFEDLVRIKNRIDDGIDRGLLKGSK